MVRSFQALPPVVCGGGLGQQRDVLRHDARLEAGIGIAMPLGAHRPARRPAMRVRERRVPSPLPVQLAASRTRARTSSIGSTAAIFARGSTLARSRGDERHLGVGLGAGGSRRRGRAGASDLREHLLRVEGGMLAESSDTDSDRLPATRMNGRTRTISRLPTPPGGGDANDLARGVGLAGRRQAIGLARVGARSGGAGRRAAQRGFHPLRNGGEVGLAVERRENGAAHEGRAAQAGQDRAAEPLHRDAAAVDQPAALAVDGQRRLVAEIDVLGLQARSICAAPFAVIQDRRPLHPPARRAVPRNTQGVQRDQDDRRRRQGLGTMPQPPRSVIDRARSSWPWRVTSYGRRSRDADAVPPELTPPTKAMTRGAEECGRSTASGGL